jgi:phosphatidylinositol 3-kinase
MSADATPLLVGRSELVPLEEAFLLLGPSFRDVQMREKAVQRLRQEDASSLVMYILFLVAALRHEPQPRSTLLNFMLETAAQSDEFATLFFWHLSVEKLNNGAGPLANYELAYVLLRKAVSPELAQVLSMQQVIVEKLAETVSAVANSKVFNIFFLSCFSYHFKSQRDRPAKIERLREILGGSFGVSLRGISPPLLFPLCPELKTSGIDHTTATLYKSNLLPLGLEWRVTRTAAAPREARAVDANISMRDGVLMKKTMFKKGDDLRQDQLVTTFVSIIASLLASAGLDLRLCVYRVLATGQNEGLIEVVPEAHNVSSVLEKFGSISMFLMHNNRNQASHTDAMDSYIRSCAGYSIVTFFLGVGDRHLDNILITNDGKVFHVDYGFILGRDPKPLPPAVRLTIEMIEGMGGLDSSGYQSYLTHCASAYRILRRFSPLLIALFTVVCEGLPGIESTRDAISFLYLRLNLHLDDEQASEYIKKTINDSAQLLFPQLMERLHKAAQNKRK